MTKKYKLINETKEWCGITLHRIEYLKDFADVEEGEKGGWIEKEENLSQDDDARVYGSLKLIDGCFYHTKEKTEEIEKIELDEDNELLCLEPVQKEENKPEVNLSGLEVKVTVEGKEYTATIK